MPYLLHHYICCIPFGFYQLHSVPVYLQILFRIYCKGIYKVTSNQVAYQFV